MLRSLTVTTVLVASYTVGAMFMQGCVTLGNFEIGLGRVDDPTSSDPDDAGWGIVIRPKDSNPEFEDNNEEEGNICITCRGDYVPGPIWDPNDPNNPWLEPNGCADTFWGCEHLPGLRFSASKPFQLSNSTGSGKLWAYSSTGHFISNQSHGWSSTGTFVKPNDFSSQSGVIDYHMSQGNVLVYEAMVPLDVYATAGESVSQVGTLELEQTSMASKFATHLSNGSACAEAPPGSLPLIHQEACGGGLGP